jgi:acetylornithine deacetylase/succinyl-diaminopimelate desuccinylase-like protein
MGFSTSLWGDNFPPTVFGCRQGDPSAPTLLIYNHYDVQPVDPLDLWDSDPFLATQKGDKIIARGASDNKGQAFYILTALSYFHEKENRLPCTIKILMEGEEESGSPHLGKLLQKHRKELQADYAMIVDLGMRGPQKPAITLGTRGLVGMTIEVTGTREDLHSGIHGGLAYNPLHALVEILAKVRDETGRIAIPGFYDGITASSEELLKQLSWSFSCKEYEEAFGQTPTGGEKELHPLNRVWLNPTVEINGIVGGYGGSGSKTIIPAKAIAKITCRLVPGQDPSRIGSILKNFFEFHSPKGVHTKVTLHPGSGKAARTDPSSLCIKTLARALEEVFLTKPEFILEGGTIGPVPEIQEATGAEVVLWGIGLPTDKIHSPNEEFDWIRMKQGFLVLCRTIELLKNS